MSLPIGFFSPLPLPIMVPFMFMQSAAMALGFGSFFQYGKRKISSMSNEEFNALTPEALTAQLMSSVNNMIPTVQSSFKQMEQMNVLILDAMATYFSQGVAKLDQWITQRGQNFVQNIQTGITDPIGDAISGFVDSGGQLFPSAGAEEVPPPLTVENAKYNANETYALRWINPERKIVNFGNITLKELRFLINLRVKKQLFNKIWRSLGAILLKKEKELSKPSGKTTDQAIKESGATGVVKEIAIFTATIKRKLNEYRQALITGTATQKKTVLRQVLNQIKLYNQLVQGTRSISNTLVIDSAKSLQAKKIIYKR